MEPSEYSVVKSDKWTLTRRIGTRNIPLVSDSNPTAISAIYNKICSKVYISEHDLFKDIYAHYSCKSILPTPT